MSWEKPNLLPIWEAQVCGSMRKFESRNAISADRFAPSSAISSTVLR